MSYISLKVPRTRHFSQHGSNQNADESLYFFRRFKLASGSRSVTVAGLELDACAQHLEAAIYRRLRNSELPNELVPLPLVKSSAFHPARRQLTGQQSNVCPLFTIA